ncbi:hypothetical protein MAELSTROM_49 [Pseudoalteromonas phage Maelstrom]|uniref:hypothetical protein n=1 Tax=Pseudoalteromonas phage Maelstrom TaxID=2065202 RepID=UPI000CA0E049|nr:hypothetical protein PP584_gp49 [Pseudoalteromonas phage Maelstrom]AUG84968.1 hypothetical protein MAELSTROM_49 [Pseudoalteromonas phage Maelstrom]
MTNENRYFKTPFAESGDRVEVPDTSVDGVVGFDTGFGSDYELPQGSVNKKRIERDKYNGLHHSITKNLKQWQEHLYPTWIEDAGAGTPFSYPVGMIVNHAGKNWLSNESVNQEEPGVGGKWKEFNETDNQAFRDSFALKIFQSPTDGGLTKMQTRTVDAGKVYEVRKTSDDSLGAIYSDAAGTTEIVQNGTSNVSDGAGVVEFYIADGDYYVNVNGVISHFNVTKRKHYYDSVDDMIAGSPNIPMVGDLCIVGDYYGGSNPNESGVLFFKCVNDGEGVHNGGKYIQGNSVQFKQNLKKPYCIRAWGARADNATDTKPAWDALTLYIRQNFAGSEIRFEGNYYFSSTVIFYSAFIYKGAGKGNTSLNFPAGTNGVQINPAPENSVSWLEMRDFSIKSVNEFPSVNDNKGLNIDLTAACRRLNISDVDISGFKNGVDGKCPFYLCTFKNMQIIGIVERDINDIQNYTNDNSFGFASGYNSGAGDVRDATTVTLENVFTGSFGIGIHNRYTAAMQLVNCVSERNYYGVLADKGLFGTMYQEWNKESCLNRGIHKPSGVQLTAINETSSWGAFTASTVEAAMGSYQRSLSGERAYQVYTDVEPLVISTSTQYFEFKELNGEAITANSGPSHRIIGLYEVEVSFYKTNDPELQGTYIVDVWVKEDGEAAFRPVKRAFLKVQPDDDFMGTLMLNYKGVVRGEQSNFRVSMSRVDGEGFTVSGNDISATIRRLSN